MADRFTRAEAHDLVERVRKATGNDRLTLSVYAPPDNPYKYKLVHRVQGSGAEWDIHAARMTGQQFRAYLHGILDALDGTLTRHADR